METPHNTERGQALVLIVVAIVALLGFTAIAVDGSMIYSDRRYSQSAADSASLAGSAAAAKIIADNRVSSAHWSCSGTHVSAAITAARNAAMAAATDNDQTIDADISDGHGVHTTCVNNATEKYLDIEVTMTVDTQTGFAHFVYGGVARNTVTAISRVRPMKALAFGYTIVALNPAACSGQKNGANFHGNPMVKVCGGGIYSNGCLSGNGNIDVDVKDFDCGPASQGIYYATQLSGGSLFSPSPQSAPHLQPEDFALDFTPQELCARPGAKKVNASALDGASLAPGLYCVTGSLKLSGNGAKLIGHGVTLVFLDGDIQCNGNCKFKITAPVGDPDPYPAVPGLLIYSMAQSTWKLNGNNESYFRGTILAPKADVALLGTGNEESFMTQVIAWNFEGGGNNDSVYKWNDEVMMLQPVELDLNR